MEFDRGRRAKQRAKERKEEQTIEAYVNTELVKLGFYLDQSVTGEPITPRQREMRRLVLYKDPWVGIQTGHVWRPDSEAPPVDLELLRKCAENTRLRNAAYRKARGNREREDELVQQIEEGPFAISSAERETIMLNTHWYRVWALANGDLITHELLS